MSHGHACSVVSRALPSPSIPTPTSQEMQDIVEFVVADRDTLNLEQVAWLFSASVPGILPCLHACLASS